MQPNQDLEVSSIGSKEPFINVRGTKVGLGPFLPAHHALYLESLQDPEVSVYGNGSFEVRLPKPAAELHEKSKDNEVVFTVFELEHLTMIGESILHEIDYRHGIATFGITIIRKDYWGQGYGTEATKLVLDYAFRFLNLYNIYLLTTSFNPRAVRAYQKAGFKEIGRRRGSLLVGGQRYDDIYMDCLASEFESPVPGWFSL
jgi:RimJ/RimL family protein N-acetyltransferase